MTDGDHGRDEYPTLGGRVLAVALLVPLFLVVQGSLVLLGAVVPDPSYVAQQPVVAGFVAETPPLPSTALVLAGAQCLGASVLLDVAVRLAGVRRTLHLSTVWLPRHLRPPHRPGPRDLFDTHRARYGPSIRPNRYGATEVATLPALTLVPLLVMRAGQIFEDGGDWRGTAVLLVGLTVATLSLVFGVYGRTWIALGTALVAWPPWAVLLVAGKPVAASVVSGVVTTLLCVGAYRVFTRLRAEQEARQAPAEPVSSDATA